MNTAHLNAMVRQIMRNQAHMGQDAATLATARHIVEFWEPRMIASFRAAADPENMAVVCAISALHAE